VIPLSRVYHCQDTVTGFTGLKDLPMTEYMPPFKLSRNFMKIILPSPLFTPASHYIAFRVDHYSRICSVTVQFPHKHMVHALKRAYICAMTLKSKFAKTSNSCFDAFVVKILKNKHKNDIFFVNTLSPYRSD
jgi:hypothetical protein